MDVKGLALLHLLIYSLMVIFFNLCGFVQVALYIFIAESVFLLTLAAMLKIAELEN